MTRRFAGRARDGRGSPRSALVVTGTLLLPFTPEAPAPKAEAVQFPNGGFSTGFQIDGNKTASGNLPNEFDWDDFLYPAPTSSQTPVFHPTAPYTTVDGLQSSGVFEGAFNWDDGIYGNCDGRADNTVAEGGQDVNTNPWSLRTSPHKPGDKNNLCSAGYAVEALSDDSGLRHFLLYGYFTRRTGGSATASTFTVFDGGPNGRCDDLMLDMNWPDREDEYNVRFLSWTPALGDDCANKLGPGTWAESGRSIDFVRAMGVRTRGRPWATIRSSPSPSTRSTSPRRGCSATTPARTTRSPT